MYTLIVPLGFGNDASMVIMVVQRLYFTDIYTHICSFSYSNLLIQYSMSVGYGMKIHLTDTAEIIYKTMQSFVMKD